MSGLVKAKKYDWTDSNLALFGSDTENAVKKESAESEPMWKGAGMKKFKVTRVPEEEHGKFYNGDSYIILNTYKNEGEDDLNYDVHFWIGSDSSQDEYGTAAYKTVELDTFLDDKPIQHREVMDHESELFKTYFKVIELMEGGADSGFRHVTPEEYKPRLLHFSGTRGKVSVKEVPLMKGRLDSSDVFILDLGLQIYQWNGKSCNKDEKFKAVQYLQTIKSERGGKPKTESLDENEISPTHLFYESLADGEPPAKEEEDSDFTTTLLRVSDETGSLEMNEVASGIVTLDHFSSEDVCILDTGRELFVRIGGGASADERKNSMSYAHNYLMKTKHPLIPVTCLKEGKENSDFRRALSAAA